MNGKCKGALAGFLLCSFLLGAVSPVGYGEMPVEKVSPVKAISFQKDLDEAAQENPDAIGWLYIENKDLDHPVFQAQDNDYYLDRGEDKESFWHGCIYADYRNSFNEGYYEPRNITLYAHNKDDRTYFSTLLDYRLLDQAKKSPYIYFTTQDGDAVYKVFAAFYTEAQLNYNTARPTDRLFTQLVQEAKKRSQITFDVDVSTSDQLLTLSTCCYKYSYPGGGTRTDQRFVVMARRLRQGESVNDPVNMWVNPNPKAPQFKN